MVTAKVFIYRLIQDSQEYGSNDEYMVSRVFFNLKIGEKSFKDLYSNIKQTVGSDFNSTPLEISSPIGYEGPFNYLEFRNLVEAYVRDRIGPDGKGINMGGAKNVRMRNNTFDAPFEGSFEVKP